MSRGPSLRNLEALVWIARLGGIGAAARQLNLTQPAITRRVRELELDIGGEVLVRTPSGVRLTPVGRTCVVAAERMLDQMDTLLVSVSSGRIAGRFRLGVGEVVALTWLQEFVHNLGIEFPGVALDFDVDLSRGLAERLARGALDLALIPGPVGVPGVVRRRVWRSSLDWMSAPGRFDVGDGSPSRLAEVPIVALSSGAAATVIMEDWFAAGRCRPHTVSCCNSLAVVGALVRAGLGVAMLPNEVFGEDIAAGRLVRVPTRPPIGVMDYWVAFPLDGRRPILERFAEIAARSSGLSAALGNPS